MTWRAKLSCSIVSMTVRPNGLLRVHTCGLPALACSKKRRSEVENKIAIVGELAEFYGHKGDCVLQLRGCTDCVFAFHGWPEFIIEILETNCLKPYRGM